METTIPGVDISFDEEGFRSQIKGTMQMGMPVALGERLTWHWNALTEYASADDDGEPFDWTSAPTVSTPGNPQVPGGSLVVDYAIQYQVSARTAAGVTPMGVFDAARAMVTLLDVDYTQIVGADYCTLGNSVYDIDFITAEALFGVGVYTVYLQARDQA